MIGVLFSGGVDSTYALHTALQSGEQVCTVHCHFPTMGHAVPQIYAIEAILAEYRRLGHVVHHEQLTFGSTMPWPHEPYFFPAIALISLMKKYPIHTVYLGDCLDDLRVDEEKGLTRGYEYQVRLGTIMALFHYTVIDPRATTTPPAEYEIGQDKTKRELFLSLPESIRSLCWGCDNPTRLNPGQFIPCGVCPKCEVYNEFVRQDRGR